MLWILNGAKGPAPALAWGAAGAADKVAGALTGALVLVGDAPVVSGPEMTARALTDVEVAHLVANQLRLLPTLVLAHSPALEKLGLARANNRLDWF